MPKIQFFSEGVSFRLSNQRKIISWIKKVIQTEGLELTSLNYVFCSDEYLLILNRQYLNHTTYTDIITFDNRDNESAPIEGDIFISIERVEENSLKFKTTFERELNRVIIHGVLHLVGYSDKSQGKKALMRKKEDTYLSLLA
ncbi:MAG TPA: rRNA maturation RNase YbeY [Ohtaekwangia sp.]